MPWKARLVGKQTRQVTILELIKEHRVGSQEALRERLQHRGINVTQATLSRDIRELRVVKVQDAEGTPRYRKREEWENAPPLPTLLPVLFLSAEGTGNLLVVRTTYGGAKAVAIAIDSEEWPEVLGTIAGDDTILLILKNDEDLPVVECRLSELAGNPC